MPDEIHASDLVENSQIVVPKFWLGRCMKLKNLLGGVALVAALSGYANAQSLTAEAVKTSRSDENHTLRLSGSYGPVSGFVDSFGRDAGDYYTEIYVRKNFKRFGIQAEINKGSRIYTPATLRAGPIVDLVANDKIYANAKLLPVTVTKDGLKKEVQISGFGSIKFPKGIYVEAWADHNFGVDPFTLGEITVGKMLTKKAGAEFQYARNVNSNGNAFRAGLRYKLF